MEKALFIILAVAAVAAALNILVQRNPLYSAVSLIGTLAAVSALYIMLRAQFIAAMQIIVYAGAIMVLFVFVIMLLNAPGQQHAVDKHKWLRYLAAPFAAAMLGEALYIFKSVPAIQMQSSAAAAAIGSTESIGVSLFTTYLLPFEVTSVLILMAVVGAIVLARREGD
ncbi:MAG TPA: NADH-quinone oxidoreductase subunit J [Blastocatellia bacterium]|nr:NADH-quinone oxidoreductase subunit J [Blastocatellia bacterium]